MKANEDVIGDDIKKGMVIDTPEAIEYYKLCVLKRALKLEIVGLKRSRGLKSAYSIIKDEFGFKGNKKKVLEQLEAKLR